MSHVSTSSVSSPTCNKNHHIHYLKMLLNLVNYPNGDIIVSKVKNDMKICSISIAILKLKERQGSYFFPEARKDVNNVHIMR